MDVITTNFRYVISSCNDLNIMKIKFAEDEKTLFEMIYNLICREFRHYGISPDETVKIIGSRNDFVNKDYHLYCKSKLYSLEFNSIGANYEIIANDLSNSAPGPLHFVLRYISIPENAIE